MSTVLARGEEEMLVIEEGRQVNMLGDGMVREFPFHMFSFLN